MIICKVCGQQNAESESFCTNCGAFLGRAQDEPAPTESAASSDASASDGPPGESEEPAAGSQPPPESAQADADASSVPRAGTRPGNATPPDEGASGPSPDSDQAADASTPEDRAGDEAGEGGAGTEAAGAAAAAGAGAITPPTEKIIIRSQKPATGTARQPPSGEPERQVDSTPVVGGDVGSGEPTVQEPGLNANEIRCPTCGRANTLDRTFCRYCSSLLRPAAETGPVVPPTPRPGITLDGRTIAIGAVAVGVAALALGVLFLRQDDDPTSSPEAQASPSPTVAPATATPAASASAPVESEAPSSQPSELPSATPEPQIAGVIAFHTDLGNNAEIWTIEATGDGDNQVTTAPGRDWDPDLSWDGTMLAWASPLGIMVSDIDGDGEYQLTHHGDQDLNPAWNPAGDRIAYSSTRDGRWEVYVREAFEGASTDETIRLTNSDAADYEPSWSPRGDEIVFTRGQNDNADIYRMSVPELGDTPGKPEALTSNDSAGITDEDPAWAPDGDRIAFSRTPLNGQADLYVLTLDTGEERRLTRTSDSEEHDPAWSPDSNFLAYQADGVIEIIRVDTGEVVSTLQLPGRASHAAWR